MTYRKLKVSIIAVFVLFLWIPLLTMPVQLDPLYTTKHKSASWEKVQEAQGVSDKIVSFENYFNEYFGFRDSMVVHYNRFYVHALGLSPKPKVLVGTEGWLYYKSEAVPDGHSLDDYQGKSPLSHNQIDEIVNNLTEIQTQLSQKNIQFIVVVAPSKHTIYPEFLPDHIQESPGETRFDQIIGEFENSESNPILDLREPLMSKKEDKQLYYKTDSHWNSYGAFIAYEELMNVMEENNPEIRPFIPGDYDISSRKNRGEGDLAGMLSIAGYLDDTEYIFALWDSKEYTNENYDYPTRFYNIRRTADTENDKKVLVFRDSFFTHVEPFITQSFDESIFLWTDYYDKTIVEKEKPDIVIWEVAERYIHRLAGKDIRSSI